MWIRLAAAVFAGAGLGAAVSAQELVQVFEVNPVEGGQIVDHGIRHTGVDLTFQVGEQVILPIAVTVIGIWSSLLEMDPRGVA